MLRSTWRWSKNQLRCLSTAKKKFPEALVTDVIGVDVVHEPLLNKGVYVSHNLPLKSSVTLRHRHGILTERKRSTQASWSYPPKSQNA